MENILIPDIFWIVLEFLDPLDIVTLIKCNNKLLHNLTKSYINCNNDKILPLKKDIEDYKLFCKYAPLLRNTLELMNVKSFRKETKYSPTYLRHFWPKKRSLRKNSICTIDTRISIHPINSDNGISFFIPYTDSGININMKWLNYLKVLMIVIGPSIYKEFPLTCEFFTITWLYFGRNKYDYMRYAKELILPDPPEECISMICEKYGLGNKRGGLLLSEVQIINIDYNSDINSESGMDSDTNLDEDYSYEDNSINNNGL